MGTNVSEKYVACILSCHIGLEIACSKVCAFLFLTQNMTILSQCLKSDGHNIFQTLKSFRIDIGYLLDKKRMSTISDVRRTDLSVST
jgi:hypothetical protein